MAVFDENDGQEETDHTPDLPHVPEEPVENTETNESNSDDVTAEEAGVEHRTYISQENMKTSMLFDKEVPIETITNHVSGMKWEVNYYLQLLNVQDQAARPDRNLSTTLQKYHLIHKLTLHLQTPLEQADVNEMEGEAVINADILPNKYDAFIATLGGGREAIFTIEDVKKGHVNLKNIYRVKFKLFYLIDNDTTLYNNMVSKVTHEYVYDSEYIYDKTAPVKVKKEYLEKLSYKEKVPELIDYYLKHFINKEKNIIALPSNEIPVY